MVYYEDVGELDVPIDLALPVDKVHGHHQLLEDESGHVLVQGAWNGIAYQIIAGVCRTKQLVPP